MTHSTAFQTLRHTMSHEVIEIRDLTEDTYVLRCERGDVDFIPGQHLSVGPKNDLNMREYSVYSGENQDFLEILIKEIQEGLVSKELRKVSPSDTIKLEGPFGSFIITEEDRQHPLYMVATGTGISPFHCFSLSYPDLPFTVLHGVSNAENLYEKETFDKPHLSYIPCISKGAIDDIVTVPYATPFQGRVTDYLDAHSVALDGMFYLCGNCDMIYEVFDLLQKKGVPSENIKAEVYF